MPDVVVHIQFVGSGSFCNAVDDGTGLRSSDSIDGHPVLVPQSTVSQCPLAVLFKHQDNMRRRVFDL